MAINVVCSCGKKMQVKDALAGRRGKCPACGQVLTIPAPQPEDDPLGSLGGLDLGALGGQEGSADPLGGPADPLGAADPLGGPALPASSLGKSAVAGSKPGGPGLATPSRGKTARPAATATPWYRRWYVLAGAGGGILLLLIAVGVVLALVLGGGPSPEVAVQQPVAVASAADISPEMADPSDSSDPSDSASDPPEPSPPEVVPQLRIVQAEDVILEPGQSIEVDIQVDRAGVQGPIEIVADGLPERVTVASFEIPAGQNVAKLKLTAAQDAPEGEAPGRIVAAAGEVTAEQAIHVVVRQVPPPTFVSLAPVSIQPGETVVVELTVERNGHDGPLQVTLEELPAKVTAKPLTIPADQNAGTLELTAASDAAEIQKEARLLASVADRRGESPLSLHVEKFPFRILPLAQPVVWLKPESPEMVEVKIERRSFRGPVELQVDGLPDLVSAAPVTVAAEQTSGMLELSAAPGAKDGVRSARLVSTAGETTMEQTVIVRVKTEEGSLLPEVGIDPRLRRLLRGGSFGGRVTAESKQMLMDVYGGTEESEAAVMAGLRWLARHQASDGSWSLESYHKVGRGCDCRLPFEQEVKENNTAGTAFGLLPLLGAGITPDRAPNTPLELVRFQRNVRDGLAYLVENQKVSNDSKNGDLGGGMYAHAFATIALCEAYALTNDRDLQIPTRNAVKYLTLAQHNGTGGWGYSAKQEGDTSIVGWVFLAIRSGQMAGLSTDRAVLGRADKFLDLASAGPEPYRQSRYAYKPGQDPKLSLTAAGLLSRQYLGWPADQPDLIEGCKYMMTNLPPESGQKLGPSYYYYYATQVFHHMEGKEWDLWNHRMREHLIRTQETEGDKRGSWSPEGCDYGSRGGRMYSTALSLLTLQAYYRHLPLYRELAKPGT